MARIPEGELERLKAEIDLAALVRSKGVELKPHGENLLGRCPFHDDRTPSLVVTPSKNLWHCLGACSVGGSVIDWVMKAEGVSFRHAVELLREGGAAALLKSSAITPKATVPRLALPLDPKGDEQNLMREVLSYYTETLLKSPEAIDYLKSRKIYSEEAVQKFGLGYSNRTLGLRLPHKNRVAGSEIRGKLTTLGIYRESGHEHFSGSIVFPVMRGEAVTEVYGRKIRDDLRSGTAFHTYLPGPHAGVWNEECLSAKEIILCESIIDALSFWVHGFRNVTASYGVNGFTEEHLSAFLGHGVRRVLIAYDRDEAGDKAAAELAKLLASEGIEPRRVLFPKGMDANEYVKKMSPEAQALRVVLGSAEVMTRPVSSLAAASPVAAALASETAPSESPPQAPPAVEPSGLEPELKGEDIFFRLGEREYRVRGLMKNLSYEILKLNVRAAVGLKYHVDTLDLYQAKARAAFIHAASEEIGVKEEVVKRDLGRVLFKLEELQDAEIRRALQQDESRKPPEIEDKEREEAMQLLRSPSLIERILSDFERAGVVGEETNKLVGYLAATSRKLDDPLAVIIQSSSAAGKSSLMEAVLAFMPSEDKVKYSAMTGQSLFYMGEKDLKHRILAIAEEEGARNAAYALKLLQSEGEISIASTGKDPTTGRLITHQYRVEGPVMIFLTTTAVEIDEELMNRCIVLTVNETREQTRLIHELQRKAQTLEGLVAREERQHVRRLHENAQRLLRPLKVANPFAEKLTFLDSRTRTRRDHIKYLALIRAVAFLHQHQRQVKKLEHRGDLIEYIEVEERDIEIANRLAKEVLGRGMDELPPQARRLLSILTDALKSAKDAPYYFSRKEVREWSGWSDFQVQTHLTRLVSMEYVAVHRGEQGGRYTYELLLSATGDPELSGLSSMQSPGVLAQGLKGGYSPPIGPGKNEKSASLSRACEKLLAVSGGTLQASQESRSYQ